MKRLIAPLRLLPIPAFALAAMFGSAPGTAKAAQPDGTPVMTLVKATHVLIPLDPDPGQDSHVFRYLLDTGSARVQGYINPSEEYIARGIIKTGQSVVAAPYLTGGSMGANKYLLWARNAGKMEFVGYVPGDGGRMNVTIKNGFILVDTIYAGADCGACPTTRHIDYDTLDGIKLVKDHGVIYKQRGAH